jgi:hypothetical protein
MAMTVSEILLLIQTVVLFLTGVVIAWYTWETYKLRSTAHEQFKVMHRALMFDMQREARAAEPIFNWDQGTSGTGYVRWKFKNDGGGIWRVSIRTDGPIVGNQPGVSAKIHPEDSIATGQIAEVEISFPGIDGGKKDLRFGITYTTARLGNFRTEVFMIPSGGKPLSVGSYW